METQWRIQGKDPGGPPPLFLDQTEARRAENCLGRPDAPLSKGLDDRPPPYLKVWIRHGTGKHSVALYVLHVSALWKHAYLRHVSGPETNDQISVTFLLLHFRFFFC